MCWETDYSFFAEQEKAKKAKASESNMLASLRIY